MPGPESEALKRAVKATRTMLQKLPPQEVEQRELEAEMERQERLQEPLSTVVRSRD